MSTVTRTPSRKSRRIANACVACRQSKIKCSGEEPCYNCHRRLIRCRFADTGNKVMVSESYLRELQRLSQAQQQPSPQQSSPEAQSQYSRKQSSETGFAPDANAGLDVVGSIPTIDELLPYQPADSPLSVWTNPFTSPSATIKNTHKNRRKWIWLPPWSLWSFNARLTLMMTEKLHPDAPNRSPGYPDEDTYQLRWKACPDNVEPDITGLPSMDHALYLFNTVKFHLSYRFFDDDEFIRNAQEFYYGNAQEKASENRLWFIQFLMILAYGNAFLTESRNPEQPPGARFFLRAMSLMPDHTSMWKDSLLAIEVLILAGLYLYTVGQRESAHFYLGQATRIAQLEGLHTQLPEEELGSEMVIRCRRLWWTLYIMDRHFSSSLGLPMLTADSDITALVSPSSMNSHEDTTIGLQVKLSQLLSVILTTIYKTEKTQLSVFLERTRSILHSMAGHAQEIEKVFHDKFRNSVEAMSPVVCHIMLLYHQCVIVATRPLLLSVLKERLERLDHGKEDWQNFLTHTTSLISTGIKSAVKTVQIMSDENRILESFLPYDLEFTYGAALHLIMANALFPGEADEQSYQDARGFLDEMIRKGNKVAEARKAELEVLEELCQELATQSERRGLQTLTLVAPEEEHVRSHGDAACRADEAMMVPEFGTVAVSMAGEAELSPSSMDPQMTSNFEFLNNIGISSSEFFSIINQIDG